MVEDCIRHLLISKQNCIISPQFGNMIFAAPVASLQMEELHAGVPLLWSKQEELKNPDRIENNLVTIVRIELQRRRNKKNGKNMKIQE